MRWHPQHSIHDVTRFLERQWHAAELDVSPHDSPPLWSDLAFRPVDARALAAERERAIAEAGPEREPEFPEPETEPPAAHP